ncbi:MAG: 50S ribosomal protein L22 [Patescibacteria group bacterium]|nr:50S ribosomal protein L22 [Patescibacteria group bacterium]
MEIVARSKSVRISPRKIRLVASAIKNISVEKALILLSTVEKRAAIDIEKTLKSAVANAVHNGKLNKNTLLVDRIEVNEGPTLKRFRPSTRGRVHPYKKRSSHIMVVLRPAKPDQDKLLKEVKNGTKS